MDFMCQLNFWGFFLQTFSQSWFLEPFSSSKCKFHSFKLSLSLQFGFQIYYRNFQEWEIFREFLEKFEGILLFQWEFKFNNLLCQSKNFATQNLNFLKCTWLEIRSLGLSSKTFDPWLQLKLHKDLNTLVKMASDALKRCTGLNQNLKKIRSHIWHHMELIKIFNNLFQVKAMFTLIL